MELKKFTLTAEQLTDPMQVWCYFLRHGERLDSEKLPARLDIPPVKKAMEVLGIMSQDTQQREAYLSRLRAKRDLESDMRSTRAEGVEEGIEKGIDRGAVMGRIELCQELLGLPQTPRQELKQWSDEELSRLAAELQQRVKSRP